MAKQVQWGNSNNRLAKPQTQSAVADFQGQMAEEEQKNAALLKVLEPHLKKALFEALRNGEELTVTRPITYITEALMKSKAGAQYKTVTKRIKSGTRLVFKAFYPKLNQILLENVETGEDYEFYPTPVLANSPTSASPNPMWSGMLQNTNVYDDFVQRLRDEGKIK